MINQNRLQQDTDRPVVEHLAELRRRLIVTVASVIVLTAVIYSKAFLIVEVLKRSVGNEWLDLAFFSLTGAFVLRVKLSFIASLIALSPLIGYQLFAFIGPGLTAKERKVLLSAVFYMVPCFVLGVVLSYVVVVPSVLHALLTYGNSYMKAALSGEEYISFIAMLCVVFGLVFTLPFPLIALGKLGLLRSSWMKKVRVSIVLSVLIGEGLFAADITSVILLAIPLILIYEISLRVVIRMEKRREAASL
ncbi:twin-arginine translocase subunit TatC [Paenibacillus brasilensis]|uniref:Sec-independent protein translocase protein TatC n=1 Tax=Paenibacillus brasilensis TaxID=128574 RepID=A0ABU0L713_9BACL|nr:twin-arginine translocase subunit TatC [Paenibacillus brasilensis]MDQ0497080.1 sec-independent protein translocase protein TatC [Paenibacillus brasilensis]